VFLKKFFPPSPPKKMEKGVPKRGAKKLKSGGIHQNKEMKVKLIGYRGGGGVRYTLMTPLASLLKG